MLGGARLNFPFSLVIELFEGRSRGFRFMISHRDTVYIEGIYEHSLSEELDIDRVGVREIESCVQMDQHPCIDDSRDFIISDNDGSIGGNLNVFHREGRGFHSVQGEATAEVGVVEIRDF